MTDNEKLILLIMSRQGDYLVYFLDFLTIKVLVAVKNGSTFAPHFWVIIFS